MILKATFGLISENENSVQNGLGVHRGAAEASNSSGVSRV